jgi:hypothetical protein
VLQHVDARLDRLAEALDRGRVRLRDDAGAVAFLDDRLLRLGRELEEVLLPVAAGAYQEIDAARDVALDLLCTCSAYSPDRARVLFPNAVDAAHRAVAVVSAATLKSRPNGPRPTMLPGDERARADDVAAIDAVADVDQRLQRPHNRTPSSGRSSG